MAEAVLDAPALLAFLQNEPGAEEVAAVLTRSCISAVNLAETISKMVEYGKPLDDAGYQIERLRIPVIPFDAEHAKMVASLWKATRVAGLSLGDRACLAIGLKTGLPVLTTERAWAKVKVGVDVGVIR
ncbi:MAG: type II toxin-antitoxin system VapC family toxin [Solirubrobacterales bacterium]